MLQTVRSHLSGLVDEGTLSGAITDPSSSARLLSPSEERQFQAAYRAGFRINFLVLSSLAALAFFVALFLMPQSSLDREDDELQKRQALDRLQVAPPRSPT